MLKKLKTAEKVCNITAFASGFLFLVAMSGEETRTAGVIVVLILMIAAAVAASKLREEINLIEFKRQRSMPECTTHATAGKHRLWHWYTLGSKGGIRGTGRTSYYITFHTEKRGEIELAVPKDVYYAVKEGAHGHLCYRGSAFISFRHTSTPGG